MVMFTSENFPMLALTILMQVGRILYGALLVRVTMMEI